MNTIPRKCSGGAIWLCLILGLVTGCSDPAATAETDEILDEVKTKHLSENTFWLEQGWAGKCVPDALICAFEADSFEDAIRNAVSLGGDADTLAAIAGSVAEALYGITDDLIGDVSPYLNPELKPVIKQFYDRLPDMTVSRLSDL